MGEIRGLGGSGPFPLPHAPSPNPMSVYKMEVPAGLYVHVPFCRRKCLYCDFASGTDLAQVPEWLAFLAREMAMYRDFAPRYDTLYLGGGTPSLLERG